MRRPSPGNYARTLVEIAEEQIPNEWNTDQIADFWQHMSEDCVLRLIKYKPEMVRKVSEER